MFRKKTRSEANGVLAAEAFPMRAASGGDVNDALSDNASSGNESGGDVSSGDAAAKDIVPLPPQAAQHVTKKTKKNTKDSAAKGAPKKRKAKAVKTAAEHTDAAHADASKNNTDTPRKLSALDAAAKVLEEEAKPMNCQEMIAAMAAKGYWSSPTGKTPASTLYSALLRELKTKGEQARFHKTARGQFVFQAPAAS